MKCMRELLERIILIEQNYSIFLVKIIEEIHRKIRMRFCIGIFTKIEFENVTLMN